MNRTDFGSTHFLRVSLIAVACILGLLGAVTVSAHAILVKSQPAQNTKVKGPSVPVALTFNSRVDQKRSAITVEGTGKRMSPLNIQKNAASPEKLLSIITDAKPGTYIVHWQVLSIDGHITRGQISFEVE